MSVHSTSQREATAALLGDSMTALSSPTVVRESDSSPVHTERLKATFSTRNEVSQ